MRRILLVSCLFMLLTAMIDPTAQGVSATVHDHNANQARWHPAISSTALREDGDNQRRWLSLPHSRIVINPYNFWTDLTAYKFNNGPELPLNVGYYVSGEGLWLTKMLTMYVGRVETRGESRVPATTFSTSWLPYSLPFTANYDGFQVEGFDILYDLDTIARLVEVTVDKTRQEEPIDLVIAGKYAGFVTWSEPDRLLTVETRTYSYTIGLPEYVHGEIAFYDSEEAFLRGDRPLDFAFRDGVWALQMTLPADLENVDLLFTIGFAPAAEGTDISRGRARRPFEKGDVRAKQVEQMEFWDDYLSKVPHPQNFDIVWAPALGVEADEVRKSYYKAWVFVASNIIPSIPEIGYSYPQFAAGKPSMWSEGASQAKASATWESFFAMQIYAYVDPDTAWQAFEGIMSLVEDSGRIAGESLPSRKAQTAIILYHLSGDVERLKNVYPAIKRYLLWRRDNPRWIHGPHNNPNERDADFVVSALVDMAYAKEIASIIGETDDIEFWDREREALFQNYLTWFWRTPTSTPVQYYFVDTERRVQGNDLWTASGLRLDLLTDPVYVDGLLWRFRSPFNPNRTFAGFGIPKYPEIAFVTYGLLDRGLVDEARTLIDVSIRDVTRANMFAEQYKNPDYPVPDGVRPSMFGAAIMVDLVLIKNGYRMDLGSPHAVRVDDTGGVSNLMIRGKQLDIHVDPEGITVQGSYVSEQLDEESIRLTPKPGETLVIG